MNCAELPTILADGPARPIHIPPGTSLLTRYLTLRIALAHATVIADDEACTVANVVQPAQTADDEEISNGNDTAG